MAVDIRQGDCLDVLRTLPDESVNCCVTSPPYWSLRDYGVDGQLGLEATPTEYIAKMVQVFEEVRRVLRSDGTCWLNMGDTYYQGKKGDSGRLTGEELQSTNHGSIGTRRGGMAGANRTQTIDGVKPKDLMGMPWRLAFSLQEAGWWLRQDIIWGKGAPMPESVRDRCTKSHEYVFLLTKSARYLYDSYAIEEPASMDVNGQPRKSGNKERKASSERGVPSGDKGNLTGNVCGSVPWTGTTRNKRSVWHVNSVPYPGAHFATFPPKLIEPMILAGCPEAVCCDCKTPYTPVVDKKRIATRDGSNSKVARASSHDNSPFNDQTIAGNRDPHRHTTVRRVTGYQPQCDCNAESQPGVVLDPFLGSGTTAFVARQLGRSCIGIELNKEYIDLAEKRLAQKVLF